MIGPVNKLLGTIVGVGVAFIASGAIYCLVWLYYVLTGNDSSTWGSTTVLAQLSNNSYFVIGLLVVGASLVAIGLAIIVRREDS